MKKVSLLFILLVLLLLAGCIFEDMPETLPDVEIAHSISSVYRVVKNGRSSYSSTSFYIDFINNTIYRFSYRYSKYSFSQYGDITNWEYKDGWNYAESSFEGDLQTETSITLNGYNYTLWLNADGSNLNVFSGTSTTVYKRSGLGKSDIDHLIMGQRCSGHLEYIETEFDDREFETILFGKYEQDGNEENGPEPVKWIVGWINGNCILISEHIIDVFEEEIDANWKDSKVCTFINDNMYDKLFSSDEKEIIVENNGNKLFLLSEDQADYLFNGYNGFEKYAYATMYARGKGININRPKGNSKWITIQSDGSIKASSYSGIRPALIVDAAKVGIKEESFLDLYFDGQKKIAALHAMYRELNFGYDLIFNIRDEYISTSSKTQYPIYYFIDFDRDSATIINTRKNKVETVMIIGSLEEGWTINNNKFEISESENKFNVKYYLNEELKQIVNGELTAEIQSYEMKYLINYIEGKEDDEIVKMLFVN